MTKMYILERISYADFDIRVTDPVNISADKQTLVERAAELNVMRTKEEIEREITFEVNPNAVKVI